MSKNFISILSLLCACGNYDDSQDPAQPDAGVGTVEQAQTIRSSSNAQLGTRTSSSHRQCDHSTTGQVCSLPVGGKAVTYCLSRTDGASLSTTDKARVKAVITSIDNALTAWTFTELSAATCGFSGAAAQVAFKSGSVGSGSSSSSIEDFVGTALTDAGVNMVEGPGIFGSYVKHNHAVVSIDTVDIQSKYPLGQPTDAVTIAHNGLTDKAGAYGMLTYVGLGGRCNVNNHGYSSCLATDTPPLTILGTGEKCRANNWNTGAPLNEVTADASSCPLD